MIEIKNKLNIEMEKLTPLQRVRGMLLQCDMAIAAIMSGAQSYNIAGSSLTRANLNDLKNWRAQLQKEIIAAKGGLRKMTTVNFSKSNF